MKVISHLTTVHPPEDIRIYRRFSKGISGHVDRINILYCGQAPELEDEEVHFVKVDRSRRRFGRIIYSSVRMLFQARRTPSDIYHLHDPEIFWLSALLPKTSTVVVDFHENYAKKIASKSWIPVPLRKVFLFLYLFMLKVLIPDRTMIVTAANSVLDGIPKRMRDRAVEVRNLPAWEGTIDIKTNNPKRIINEKNRLKILYTGGLTEYRGIENVVKAVFYYGNCDWDLTIIGKKNQVTYNKLKEYLEDNRINYLGKVPYKEAIQLNLESDIGVVCNLPVYDYDKALPNKLFEYLSFGVPVVCSDFQQWKDVVESNNVGELCDPTSPQSIADAIRLLQMRIAQEEGYSLRCIEVVRRKYSWQVEKFKLLKVYNVI